MSPTLSPSRTWTLLLTCLLTAGLLAVALPASASPPERDAEAVDLAGAAWTVLEPDSATYVTLMAADVAGTAGGPGRERFGPSVTLFYDRIETDPETGERTHVVYEYLGGIPAEGFAFDRSLRAARATFDVTLVGGTLCRFPPGGGGPDGIVPGSVDEDPVEDDCRPLPDVPMSFDLVWTGVGPIVRGVSRSVGGEVPFWHAHAHSVVASRDAQVRGSVVVADAPAAFVWPSVDPDAGVLLRGRQHAFVVTPR